VNASLVLHELRRRGLSVQAEGDRLRFRGPTAELTAKVVEIARGCKNELLTLLNAVELDPNLVHIADDLVHSTPGFGPHRDEGGPNSRTKSEDAISEAEQGKGREVKRNSEFGPLGPP
jgi:hypothetical protein